MTVHTLGGPEMLKAAIEGANEGAAQSGKESPLVLGITMLTSISQDVMNLKLGIPGKVADEVKLLAEMAAEVGMKGFVCSPHEAPVLRKFLSPDTALVTPAIRLPGNDVQDQARPGSPDVAVANGADFLVVGTDFANAIKDGRLDEILERYMTLMSEGHDRYVASNPGYRH